MPRLGVRLGISSLAVLGGGVRWWDSQSYLIDGVAPVLAAEFARGRYALAGTPVPPSSVLAVSSGAKRVFDASGAMVTVPANTPAFAWSGGRRRLLIEGPATNLFSHSDPRQWLIYQADISNGPVGPDGVTPWCRLNDATTSDAGLARQAVNIPADTATYVASILVLHDPTAVSSAQLMVQYSGGTTQEFRLTINPITGTLGNTLGGPTAVYRTNYGAFSLIEMVCANNGSNTLARIYYFPATSSVPSFTGTTVSNTSVGWGYIGWGQFEVGTRATSRILSAGSQASRIADVVQLTPAAAVPIQDAVASLAWRGLVRTTAGYQMLIGLPGGYGLLWSLPSTPQLRLDGMVDVGTLALGSVLPGEVGTAIAWDGTGRAGAVNGGAAVGDTAVLNRPRSSVWLGSISGLPAGAAMEIDELVVWPVRGSNAALTAQARGWA